MYRRAELTGNVFYTTLYETYSKFKSIENSESLLYSRPTVE